MALEWEISSSQFWTVKLLVHKLTPHRKLMPGDARRWSIFQSNNLHPSPLTFTTTILFIHFHIFFSFYSLTFHSLNLLCLTLSPPLPPPSPCPPSPLPSLAWTTSMASALWIMFTSIGPVCWESTGPRQESLAWLAATMSCLLLGARTGGWWPAHCALGFYLWQHSEVNNDIKKV